LHIDRVDRAEMFRACAAGIVELSSPRIPPLTVIDVASAALDRESLPRDGAPFAYSRRQFAALPDTLHMNAVAELAREWTTGLPRGWPQVESVAERLRGEFVHDRTATAPRECVFPVGHFLFLSRRGPDYQFATTAALMLRTLGYGTRVVGGFYAHPDRYDRRLRHTPIVRDDVHFWVEVHLGGDTWATVEPTPGYEVLAPPPGLRERCAQWISVAGGFAARHASALIGLSIAAAAGVAFRRRLSDRCLVLMWRLCLWRRPRTTVISALRLADRRCRWTGTARPAGATPASWLRRVCRPANDREARDLAAFATLADWAAFAPREAAPPAAGADPRAVCGAFLATWTLRRLRVRDPMRAKKSRRKFPFAARIALPARPATM
jgi:hypothetical protein